MRTTNVGSAQICISFVVGANHRILTAGVQLPCGLRFPLHWAIFSLLAFGQCAVVELGMDLN